MELEKLCNHHTLRRLCETCDLADALDVANARIKELQERVAELEDEIRMRSY